MQIPVGLIQFVLIILWYTVPAMAAIPWWIILAPLLIGVAMLGLFLFFLAIIGIIAFFANRPSRTITLRKRNGRWS